MRYFLLKEKSRRLKMKTWFYKTLGLGLLITSYWLTATCPFAVTIKGGINPSFFTDRGNVLALINQPTCELITLGQERKFNQLFSNPGFSLAVEFAYGLCPCIELFGEVGYQHHKHRSETFDFMISDVAFTFNPNLKSLNIINAFAGFRYFFGPMCSDRVSFFAGAKVGLYHFNNVNAMPLVLSAETLAVPVQKNISWFVGTNSVAGGIQGGLDLYLSHDVSLFFIVEFVAACNMRVNPLITFDAQPNFPVTHLIRQSKGMFFTIPIQLGIRYYFG